MQTNAPPIEKGQVIKNNCIVAFHPKFGFGVMRHLYTQQYGHWLPAPEDNQSLEDRLARLAKISKKDEARICMQLCHLSDNLLFTNQNIISWDIIPNAAKKANVRLVEAADVCVVKGIHCCVDPCGSTEACPYGAASNARQLLKEIMENKDFTTSTRVDMVQAFFAMVRKIPATEYVLGTMMSGLFDAMHDLKFTFPEDFSLGKSLRQILLGWDEQKKKHADAWFISPY